MKPETPDERQARHISEKGRALILGLFFGAALSLYLESPVWEGALMGLGVAGVGVFALDYLQKREK